MIFLISVSKTLRMKDASKIQYFYKITNRVSSLLLKFLNLNYNKYIYVK